MIIFPAIKFNDGNKFHIHVIRAPSITPIWLAEVIGEYSLLRWINKPDYEYKINDILFAEDEFSTKSHFALVTNEGIKVLGNINPVPSFVNCPSHCGGYGYAWNCAYENITARDIVDIICIKNDMDIRYIYPSKSIIETIIKLLPDNYAGKIKISGLITTVGFGHASRIVSGIGRDIVIRKIVSLIDKTGYDGNSVLNDTAKRLVSLEKLMKLA